MTEEGRRIDERIELDASPDRVWHALTDAEQLARWFAQSAEVEPGPGGSISVAWEPPFAMKCKVATWQPGERLALRMARGPDIEVAVDYEIAAKGGKTELRVVQYGFGDGSDWDDEIETTRGGWRFFLRALRQLLEVHDGAARRCASARTHPLCLSRAEIWRRLTAPEGLFAGLAVDGLAEGDPVAFRGPAGDFSGRVWVHQPGMQLGLELDGLGRGNLLLELEPLGEGKLLPALWISTWGLGADAVDALQARCRALFTTLFPEEEN